MEINEEESIRSDQVEYVMKELQIQSDEMMIDDSEKRNRFGNFYNLEITTSD